MEQVLTQSRMQFMAQGTGPLASWRLPNSPRSPKSSHAALCDLASEPVSLGLHTPGWPLPLVLVPVRLVGEGMSWGGSRVPMKAGAANNSDHKQQ
eukprot:1159778-Pelagomonas_calceolata.AAC.11